MVGTELKKYQLILTGRFPITHELCYQVSCDGEILISECTYADGYRHVAQLMVGEDIFQEIEDKTASQEMSCPDVQQGNYMLNFDKIYPEDGVDSL